MSDKKKDALQDLQEWMKANEGDPDFKLMMTMNMHFQGFYDRFKVNEQEAMLSLSCSQCLDYRTKVCPGMGLKGLDVMDCMWEQAACSVFEIF
jgi:hypothetical protein